MHKLDPVTVAAVQMVSRPTLVENLLQAEYWVDQAVRQGARLVVLPENFALFGHAELRAYGESEELSEAPIRSFLSKLARKHQIWLVGGTTPRIRAPDEAAALPPPHVYASVHTYAPDGREVGRYDKIHLFDADVSDSHRNYRESDSLAPGQHPQVVLTALGRLGFAVCYDLRFPGLFARLQVLGMDLLVVPSAFTEATGAAHWLALLKARAIESQCLVIAANQGGDHGNGRFTHGHSCIIDGWGRLLNQMSYGEGVVLAKWDAAEQRAIRSRLPVLLHRKL
jgi:deaminated glutathione amidase